MKEWNSPEQALLPRTQSCSGLSCWELLCEGVIDHSSPRAPRAPLLLDMQQSVTVNAGRLLSTCSICKDGLLLLTNPAPRGPTIPSQPGADANTSETLQSNQSAKTL